MTRKLQLFLLLLLIPLFSACSLNNKAVAPVEEKNIISVDSEGNTKFDANNLQAAIDVLPTFELTSVEKDGLLFMVEEEKLAKDVYSVLYTKWQQQSFDNISQSEATHVSAVQALLEKYKVALPGNLSKAGVFTNPDLQKLYNDLVKKGETSLVEALKVGTAVEEIDILDLEKRLVQTDKEDIKLVYNNLMRGSRNHLRSFVRNIKNQGQTYSPQYLSQTVYDQIISSANEKGSNNQGSGRGKR